jgi:3'-phosphoadenosine 5'-phosphosulfate (PAPS) 3'-phosphatase
VKELSWEEQEIFLRRQLEASVEAIREKLATSYPDYPFLTEWEPEILKKSLKAWVFALSGEQNYVLGIDDFTLTISLIELGKPMQLVGFTPNTQAETRITQNEIIRNGYRIKTTKKNPSHNRSEQDRRTQNCLEDWIVNKKLSITTYSKDSEKVLIMLNKMNHEGR